MTYNTGVQNQLKAVGIDATMNVITAAQLNDFQCSGKSWQGLAAGKTLSDPDWVSVMTSIYNGYGSYVNMLLPDDYSQALNSAVMAPDFPTKQKFAQQANKLAVDKYALMIPMYSFVDDITYWAYVHNTGLFETSQQIWTPEEAWLGKR